MSRRTLINLLFFNAVFLAMLWWAVNNIVTVDRVERPYTITGDFLQAAGVKANAEVTYLGVHYGRVTGVERIPSGVHITMKVDRDKDIPAGAVARIFRKSAIGEPYIDFIPGKGYDRRDRSRIEPGENVPLDRTRVPLEFSALLRSASEVISSIDPDTAGSLVHELSLALDGRGDSLRTLTTSIDDLSAKLVTRTDQLDRLAENSTRLTSVLADHRTSLSRSLANLRAVTEALERANGDLTTLLDIGPDFLGTTADLVADEKQNLDCLLTDLAPVLRQLAQPGQLDDLAGLLTNGPLAFGYAAAVVDHDADGPWARVNLLTSTGEDPNVYVPPKSLPVVPSIPACASNLKATTAASYSAGGGSGVVAVPSAPATPSVGGATGSGTPPTSSDDLANTGGIAALAAALLLTVGALVLWHLRRDRTTPSTR